MINVILRSISINKNKSHVTAKLTFGNRDDLKDFMMSMSYNNKPIIIEVEKEYAARK